MRWSRTRPAAIKPRPAAYGKAAGWLAVFLGAVMAGIGLLAVNPPALAADRPVKIAVLGDSLSTGLGLPAADAFPAKLRRALEAKGYAVEVTDAGVSGDTASAGLARVNWSVPEGIDAVIVEFGANDALRGIDPKVTRAALDSIVRQLKSRGIEVLLAGMQAPRNLGPDYVRAFDSIFPELAAAHGVLFYPFFLDGVATEVKLNQADGLHPNAAGVDVIVQRVLPKAEELVKSVRAKRPS